MAEQKKTDTTLFIMPAFGVEKKHLESIGFIDAFIADKDHPNIDKNAISIYVLFKPDSKQKLTLKKVMDLWEKNLTLIEDYDYPNGYTVLVLRFPEQFRKDYELYLEGKFSKFSVEYKQKMPEQTEAIVDGRKIPGMSTPYMVVHKEERMRKFWEQQFNCYIDPKDEYWGIPNVEKETLDIDKILNKDKHKDKGLITDFLNQE